MKPTPKPKPKPTPSPKTQRQTTQDKAGQRRKSKSLVSELNAVRAVCPANQLGKTYKSVVRTFESEFRGQDVTTAQFQILVHIEVLDDPGCSDLAAETGSDPSTVSRIVDGLERRGFVESRPGEDRRTQRYSLSASGLSAVRNGLKAWRRAYERTIEHIGEERWGEMQQLLSSIE